jgi:hypothetical protein
VFIAARQAPRQTRSVNVPREAVRTIRYGAVQTANTAAALAMRSHATPRTPT